MALFEYWEITTCFLINETNVLNCEFKHVNSNNKIVNIVKLTIIIISEKMSCITIDLVITQFSEW